MALALFQSQREAETTSQRSQRNVEKISRYSTKLQHALRLLLDDQIFFSAQQSVWSSRPRRKDSDIKRLISELKRLDVGMAEARSRMTMKPGRKSIQAIDFLVQNLNQIQAEVSTDYAQRSGKLGPRAKPAEFIIQCCAKVRLTRAQVLRSLKRTISNANANLIDYGFDEAAGKNERAPKRRRSRIHRPPEFGAFRKLTSTNPKR